MGFEAEEQGEGFSRGVDLPRLGGDRPGSNGVVEAGDDRLGAAGALESRAGWAVPAVWSPVWSAMAWSSHPGSVIARPSDRR